MLQRSMLKMNKLQTNETFHTALQANLNTWKGLDLGQICYSLVFHATPLKLTRLQGSKYGVNSDPKDLKISDWYATNQTFCSCWFCILMLFISNVAPFMYPIVEASPSNNESQIFKYEWKEWSKHLLNLSGWNNFKCLSEKGTKITNAHLIYTFKYCSN